MSRWALLAGVFVFTAVLAFAGVGLWAQETWLKSMPAQGYTPGTIVIEKDAPAKNLVCVVPDRGGTYACITVGELRAYVFNRKMLR